MLLRIFILTGAAILAPLGGAPAQSLAKTTMTCPIGGGTFDYAPAVVRPSDGERPDGKPYGVAAPPRLPECPGNGLVLYKDYSAEEVAKLEPLIASDAYRKLLTEGTQYYRAYWLMKEMGLPPENYLWALLQASWEADGNPELRQRYLAELAEASGRVAPRPARLNWIGMEGRAINALRELGRFEEALARLDKVPVKSLAVAAPAADDQSAAAREARIRRGWHQYFTQMRVVLGRRDTSLEPLELLPRSLAFGQCLAGEELAEGQRAFCESQQAAVEEFRAARARQARELEALKKPRDQSGR
jgi:hypothetical protein